MSDVIIQVENLGKQYQIGAAQEVFPTLRDRLVGLAGRAYRSLRTGEFNAASRQTFWALRQVDFKVRQGEVVGVIGRNGAGKSTLLKLLSHITEPTEGRIRLHGRVGSLLEVGTGFHPELTGRENIYLNGAILGMRQVEIERKFDEIIAFSEIEKFLDTPVKRYSSGMYVRLAFAVAAHLEPEILLIDEILAVGDARFQEKCLNKMDDVARGGRTILFVSHNMAAIQTLCPRSILLDGGQVVQDGPTDHVVPAYLNPQSGISQQVWPAGRRPGNRSFEICGVGILNNAGQPITEVRISEDTLVQIEFTITRPEARVVFSVVLFDAHGHEVFASLSNTDGHFHDVPLPSGSYRAICLLYGDLLNNGRYSISIIGLADYWSEGFRIDHVLSFQAIDDGILKGDYPGNYGGAIRPRLKWEIYPVKN